MPLTVLIAAALMGQAGVTPTHPEPPHVDVLQGGTRPEFASLVYRIEDLISKSDFDGASKLMPLLPQRDLRIAWDDRHVPAAKREAFRAVAEQAAKMVGGAVRGNITLTAASKELKISFEPVLATPPDASMPAGATLFFSEDPSELRLEAVIGLKRGPQGVRITEDDVFNEVGHALGAYYGLTSADFSDGIMNRTDLPGTPRLRLSAGESMVARADLKIAAQLANLIQTKTVIHVAKPSLYMNPVKFEIGDVPQGPPVPIQFQISNPGDAPLIFQVKGDCACVDVNDGGTVDPGQTYMVRGVVDTRSLPGEVRRNIMVATNDPNDPIRTIPVNGNIQRRYTIDSNVKGATSANEDGVAEYDTTITFAPGAKKFKVLQAALAGLPGTATFTEIKDGDELTGYAFHVTVTKITKGARYTAELNVLTDDEFQRIMRIQTLVQWGPTCIPNEVYLPTINKARDVVLEVVQPRKPFKVLSATSSLPFFKTKIEPWGVLGYRVTVHYDGKMPSAAVTGYVTIKTDIPGQEPFQIPINAAQ